MALDGIKSLFYPRKMTPEKRRDDEMFIFEPSGNRCLQAHVEQ
jgi:hypothetical protein